MKYTANLKLKKPEGTDVVNIDDLNDNVDILDREITQIKDKANNINAGDIKLADGKTIEGKFTEVQGNIGNINDPALPVELKGKSLIEQTKQLFQSGLDGKNLLETSIKSKGGTVSKQGTIATFNELDLGIKSIETDKTGDATAIAGDILSGKTAYVKGKKLTGTMPNRGSLAQTITTQGGQYNLPSGYYNGGYVKAQFPNLVKENIREGVNIGGVVGTLKEIKVWSTEYGKSLTNGITYSLKELMGFRPDIVLVHSYSWVGDYAFANYIRDTTGYLGNNKTGESPYWYPKLTIDKTNDDILLTYENIRGGSDTKSYYIYGFTLS